MTVIAPNGPLAASCAFWEAYVLRTLRSGAPVAPAQIQGGPYTEVHTDVLADVLTDVLTHVLTDIQTTDVLTDVLTSPERPGGLRWRPLARGDPRGELGSFLSLLPQHQILEGATCFGRWILSQPSSCV